MENPWKIHGKSMENLWKIYGKSMENLWKISGKYLENLWKNAGWLDDFGGSVYEFGGSFDGDG